MITQNESRSTIGQQLYLLVSKHGLENIAESLMHLCMSQAELKKSDPIEKSIGHLEDLIKSASKIEAWN